MPLPIPSVTNKWIMNNTPKMKTTHWILIKKTRRVLLKRGNGKRKTEDYSAETCRGNALIFRRIGFPFPPNSTHIFIWFLKYGNFEPVLGTLVRCHIVLTVMHGVIKIVRSFLANVPVLDSVPLRPLPGCSLRITSGVIKQSQETRRLTASGGSKKGTD